MVDRPEACATLAHELDEPLGGSAPNAVGWVLVEDPGPWGHDALADGTLPAEVRRRFAEWPAGVRFQAVRRGPTSVGDVRNVWLVHAGRRPWARHLELHVDEIADVDATLTLRPEPPTVGRAHDQPIVLVCTHAKRDACCAVLGRPVAEALLAAAPSIVWETSHTGGHRFAPNVVTLPDGAVYGHLELDTAVEVVSRHLEGELGLDNLRGHAGDHRAVQAAEVALRRQLGISAAADVDVAGAIVRGRDATVLLTVWVDDRGTGWRVVLHEDELAPRPVSCGADPKDPGAWVVTDLGPM